MLSVNCEHTRSSRRAAGGSRTRCFNGALLLTYDLPEVRLLSQSMRRGGDSPHFPRRLSTDRLLPVEGRAHVCRIYCYRPHDIDTLQSDRLNTRTSDKYLAFSTPNERFPNDRYRRRAIPATSTLPFTRQYLDANPTASSESSLRGSSCRQSRRARMEAVPKS